MIPNRGINRGPGWLMLGRGREFGGAGGGELYPPAQEMAVRALRMLERLVAGSTLTEVAAGEGLTRPRRARSLSLKSSPSAGSTP